jgi:hypothetical protein
MRGAWVAAAQARGLRSICAVLDSVCGARDCHLLRHDTQHSGYMLKDDVHGEAWSVGVGPPELVSARSTAPPGTMRAPTAAAALALALVLSDLLGAAAQPERRGVGGAWTRVRSRCQPNALSAQRAVSPVALACTSPHRSSTRRALRSRPLTSGLAARCACRSATSLCCARAWPLARPAFRAPARLAAQGGPLRAHVGVGGVEDAHG